MKQADQMVSITEVMVQMYHIRGQYTNVHLRSNGAAEVAIARIVRPSTLDCVTRTEKNQTETKRLLRLIRDDIKLETVREDVPRPSICARMISDHVLSETIATAQRNITHPQTFVLMYDVACGILEIYASLTVAVDAKDATSSQHMKQVHAIQREYNIGISSSHIQQISDTRWIDEANEAAQLLKDDPSGFALIDLVINELKAQASGRPIRKWLRMEHYQIHEFVIAGAEQAQAIYKTLYPLTENL